MVCDLRAELASDLDFCGCQLDRFALRLFFPRLWRSLLVSSFFLVALIHVLASTLVFLRRGPLFSTIHLFVCVCGSILHRARRFFLAVHPHPPTGICPLPTPKCHYLFSQGVVTPPPLLFSAVQIWLGNVGGFCPFLPMVFSHPPAWVFRSRLPNSR